MIKEWRPEGWGNPYEEYKNMVFDTNGYPTFEAGASAMLEALRKQPHISGQSLINTGSPGWKGLLPNGRWYLIPDD